MDEIGVGSTPPATAITQHGPSHGVALGLVGLGDVAAGNLGIAVAGLVHLHDVHTVVVHLDLLHEDIQTLVVVVDHHLAIHPSGRIMPETFRELIREHVAQARLVERQRVQHPVILLGHAKNTDIVVRHIVGLQGRQPVWLFLRHLRGTSSDLDADASVIVQEQRVVDIRQVIARAILMPYNLHVAVHPRLVGNVRPAVNLNDHDGQVAVGKDLSLNPQATHHE